MFLSGLLTKRVQNNTNVIMIEYFENDRAKFMHIRITDFLVHSCRSFCSITNFQHPSASKDHTVHGGDVVHSGNQSHKIMITFYDVVSGGPFYVGAGCRRLG